MAVRSNRGKDKGLDGSQRPDAERAGVDPLSGHQSPQSAAGGASLERLASQPTQEWGYGYDGIGGPKNSFDTQPFVHTYGSQSVGHASYSPNSKGHAGARSTSQGDVGVLAYKIDQWLEEADLPQCKWAAKYICDRAVLGGIAPINLDWKLDDLRSFIGWMLYGNGYDFEGMNLQNISHPLDNIRSNAGALFAGARNAWNQKVDRKKKAEIAANSIVVDPETKKKLSSLCSQYGMSTQELLASLVDLLVERRSNVQELRERRMQAKKAALAVDLGLDGIPPSGGML